MLPTAGIKNVGSQHRIMIETGEGVTGAGHDMIVEFEILRDFL